jgi:YbbR domain-containing protein
MDKWFRNHTVLKIIAVFIGTMLWMVVNNDEVSISPTPSPESTMTIKDVEIIPRIDQNRFASVQVKPQTVTISITGKANVLSRIVTGEIEASVDLNKLSAGEHRSIPVKFKGTPTNVTVQVVPGFVQVNLEEKVHKEMNVTYRLKGTPSVGFKVGDPIISPSKVKITGSESLVASIDKIIGEVDVAEAEQEVIQKTKLVAYDLDGKEVKIDMTPQVVTIKVPISSPYKLLPLILDINGRVPAGYAILNILKNMEEVIVYGPQESLDALDFYIGPIVNLSNMTASNSLILNVPVHGGVNRTDPDKVKVDVEVVPSATKMFENVPLQINGTGDGLELRWIDPVTGEMDVNIEGAPAILDETKLEDIQGFVDVSQLSEGTHKVEVQWNLPLYLKKPLDPIYVMVEITNKR